MDNYLLFKSLHVLGVVILSGQHHRQGSVESARGSYRKSGDCRVRAAPSDDHRFCVHRTRAVLIAVTGPMMAHRFGGVGARSWQSWGTGSFLVCGAIWVVILIPVQDRAGADG